MALGFGFNKAKVLASAEKNVQSGKLQNAISDYEKILKEDPKDLTVLNTVGDLYARLGNNDQAVQYFKKVGDSYASEGFTVKAIAMYKKLSKLISQPESILKLAELYTVQGLYNDARAQYVTVADQYLKSGRNDEAARIFQKILELDPENTAMQSKLADLYMKLGKKQEALQIYYSAAQTLYSKQSLEAADKALTQVLSIEPGNFDALLLRGTVAGEMGKPQVAIDALKDVWDIDSRPDALRTLLRAHVQLKNFTEAQPIAVKLTTVHNDIAGISTYADALLNAGKFDEALQMYDQYSDRLLASNTAGVVKVLVPIIAKVKESASALDSLFRLFQKTGDNTHIPEIMELLAHACVQEGNLAKARDLYHMLAESEPENPLHAQNYKQVVAKLGEDSATRPLSSEQAGQAFMMDQLNHQAIIIQEQYPAELAAAVRSALTDSELFDSYNLPGKAIPLLEKALKRAPRDSQLNLRLETLYAKVGRVADAAKCAALLAELYQAHGHPDEAKKQGEMAARYQAQAAEAHAAEAAANFAPSSWDEIPMASEDVPVVTEEAPSERAAALQEAVEQVAPAAAMDFDSAFPAEAGQEATAEAAAMAEEPVTAVEEFAASSVSSFQFESSGEPAFQASVSEPEAPAAAMPVQEFGMVSETETPAAPPPQTEAHHEAQVQEWESMMTVDEAPAAEAETPASPIGFDEPPPAPAPEAPIAAEAAYSPEPATADVQADDGSVSEFVFESISAAPPVVEQPPAAATAPYTEPVAAPVTEPPPAPAPKKAPPTPAPPPPQAAPPPPTPKIVPPSPVAAPPAPAAAASADDLLGDLVSGLEDVLGDVLGDEPLPPPKTARPVSTPAPASVSAPAAMAAAPAPAPLASAPSQELHAEETTSALADMFAEFKDDVEDTAQDAEDPDTHYNLGVAFKEMGLLDEAIGELQKVCLAIDHGHDFDQKVQAYTWLAQCLVDKGVPEASARWYRKALTVSNLSEESRLAIYYDLASAQELAGDKTAAYSSFMEVYSSNIDFRDVADRIKALKA